MTVIADSQSCLKNLALPQYYVNYQESILQNVQRNLDAGMEARLRGIDVTDRIEPKIAFDLSDRVAKMHDIDIANRLRELLSKTSKERAALKIAEEIALGEYGEDDLRTRLDNAVRVSLAVVTEGVTIAPLQGIADVQLKKGSNGREYLSISFAGPIRSAGGTEAALTMLIADHARKIVGVDRYSADSSDDETGRFVEELRIDGWDWLNDLKGAIQTGNEDAVYHRMSEVITGRPVLSMTKRIGGFRLRYGRCYNTGFATIGIHPAIPIL